VKFWIELKPLLIFSSLFSYLLEDKMSQCLGNKQLRHIGEWRNSSTHFHLRLLAEVTGQFHNLTTSLPGYHSIEGRVGLRADMVIVEKKISASSGNRTQLMTLQSLCQPL